MEIFQLRHRFKHNVKYFNDGIDTEAKRLLNAVTVKKFLKFFIPEI